MKSRVVKAAGERAEGVWLSTFHSFCLEKILRAANPDIQPLDEIDHRILLRRNIAELGLILFRRLAEPAEFLKDFQTFFSRCQDELVTPDDYQRYVDALRREHETRKKAFEPDALAIAEEEVARQEELARVYRVSERLLRERNLYTFGAQLLQAVQVLRTDAELLARMRDQYRYILVDEFQDTNIAQLELLWLLAGDRRNILAVGDDDQAIYRFRGASFGSFTIFLERFCGVGGALPAASAKKALVSLSQNYRSTRTNPARGRRNDFAQREIAAAAAEESDDRERRRRKDPRGRIRDVRRRSALGRIGDRAPARSRRRMAQLRGALPKTRASRAVAGRAAAARNSIRDTEVFDSYRARWCATCWRGCA